MASHLGVSFLNSKSRTVRRFFTSIGIKGTLEINDYNNVDMVFIAVFTYGTSKYSNISKFTTGSLNLFGLGPLFIVRTVQSRNFRNSQLQF